jgi:hypothetical protein
VRRGSRDKKLRRKGKVEASTAYQKQEGRKGVDGLTCPSSPSRECFHEDSPESAFWQRLDPVGPRWFDELTEHALIGRGGGDSLDEGEG